jgi:hypothetical protein
VPTAPGSGVQPLIDYVDFAQTGQNNATPSVALASYTIRGLPREGWKQQADGPALQTLATGYNANTDIVSACIYGAVPCPDTKLLATAAQVREQWEIPIRPTTIRSISPTKTTWGLGPCWDAIRETFTMATFPAPEMCAPEPVKA